MEALLKELFAYEPETGIIRSRVKRHTRPAGTVVGRVRQRKGETPYRIIHVTHNGRKLQYFHHRVAWLLHYGKWPDGIIDHINCDSLDNRIFNLRDTTNRVNSQNRKPWGECGVHHVKGKYRVRINLSGTRVWLGTYTDQSIAERVYIAVKRELHDVGPLWDEKNMPNSSGTPA